MQIFPQTFAVGEQFGVVLVPTISVERRASLGTLRAGARRSRCDHRMRSSRSRPSAPMSATPMAVIPTKFASAKTRAKTSQRRDFTINGMMLDPGRHQRDSGFRRRPRRPEGRNRARHRRSRTALCRRQTAHAPRRAFCRALRLHDRSRDHGGDPAAGASNSPGLLRASARRTDEDAHRRPRPPRLSTAGYEPACCQKSCRKSPP